MYQVFCLMLLQSESGCAAQSLLNAGVPSMKEQAESVHYPVRLGEHPDEYAVVYSCKTDNRNTTIHK